MAEKSEKAPILPGVTFEEIALEFVNKYRWENMLGATQLRKEWLSSPAG
jgi:hypothetical protein